MALERRTARATAHLLLINAKLYEQDRDRQVTRYRFSLNTLRRLARRLALRERFIADLEEELAELGWMLLPLGGEFAIMDISKADSWTKLGSKRLVEGGFLNGAEKDLEQSYQELFPVKNEDIDEE